MQLYQRTNVCAMQLYELGVRLLTVSDEELEAYYRSNERRPGL